MKVKTILVSQPEPKTENSPYYDLEERLKVKFDFVPFIHVEGLDTISVRNQKVDLSSYSAIIFTSRNAVDHFFRIAEQMRYKIPDSLKYFCQSEAVANYLQKYVIYRKRKVYVGVKTFPDLCPHIERFKNEKFLLPSSDKLKPAIPELLDKIGIHWKQATLYKTVVSDLSELRDVFYDVLVFFSPSGIESLYENFPDFQQKDTKIAVFGNSTVKAAESKGLRIDVRVPTPENPSMTTALRKYIQKVNGR